MSESLFAETHSAGYSWAVVVVVVVGRGKNSAGESLQLAELDENWNVAMVGVSCVVVAVAVSVVAATVVVVIAAVVA